MPVGTNPPQLFSICRRYRIGGDGVLFKIPFLFYYFGKFGFKTVEAGNYDPA